MRQTQSSKKIRKVRKLTEQTGEFHASIGVKNFLQVSFYNIAIFFILELTQQNGVKKGNALKVTQQNGVTVENAPRLTQQNGGKLELH